MDESTPPEPRRGDDGPRFGVLLVVLAAAVGVMVAVTFLSLAWVGR